MQATEVLAVGQQAPDFTLKGPGGQPVSLSDYRGRKNVVLVFFPLAFSPVCSHQLPDLQQYHAEFERVGAEVRVRILFATEPEREDAVRQRITAALTGGRLTAPDGVTTSWELCGSQAGGVPAEETEHAERLKRT